MLCGAIKIQCPDFISIHTQEDIYKHFTHIAYTMHSIDGI